MESIKKAGIVIAVGASFGAAGALLYILLKKDDDMIENHSKIVKSNKHTYAEVSIPKDLLGAFIGRQGCHIKALQEETNTRLKVSSIDDDIDSPAKSITIQGSAEDVAYAKDKINDFVVNQPKVITEEIYVPQNFCGLLIGKNGSNIRDMCRHSKAKITVDSDNASSRSDGITLITLRGTPDQINLAKLIIEEKISEAKERQSDKIVNSEYSNIAKKFDDSDIKHQLALTAPPNNNQYQDDGLGMCERLIPSSSDGYLATFASAVANPCKFWLQVVGVRSTELDKLVESMTKFYNSEDNCKEYGIKKPEENDDEFIKVGDIVAAPFSFDSSWYRAKVISVIQNDYDPDLCELEMQYVDFGENSTLNWKKVCLLKQEYMKLPFQAVECCLHDVKPINSTVWPEDTIEMFEELVKVAQWKVIMAKPVDVIKRNGNLVHIVQLIDTSSSEDIDVIDELIKNQLAEKL